MHTFPQLIKKIRNSADLTQVELAKILDVSPVLVALVETEKKEVSKKFVKKLADALGVHPMSVTPFLFVAKDGSMEKLSAPERALLQFGEELQTLLIHKKAKNLKKYARSLSPSRT